jgi:lipoate-protein ligase B
LEHYDIIGERSEVNTGVWVNKDKISAVGLTASRWITMHGIALNVNCNLKHFRSIIPCGIVQDDRGVCSIQSTREQQRNKPASVDTDDVASKWIQSFADVFNLEYMEQDSDVDNELANLVKHYPAVENLSLDRYFSPPDEYPYTPLSATYVIK